MKTRFALLALAILAAGCTTTGDTVDGRKVDEKEAAHANMQLGMAYLQQGNLVAAKEKLDRAEQQDPHSFEVHWALASLSERLLQPTEADRHYQAALRLAPQNGEVSNTYGVFLCRAGKVAPALKLFDDAFNNQLYSTPWAAATNAAICLRSDKRDADAVPYLERALIRRPDYAAAVVELADVQLLLNKPDAARVAVDRFLAIGRKSPDVYLVAVRVALKQGDRVAADTYARLLRRDYPSSPQSRELQQLLQPAPPAPAAAAPAPTARP
ncbi:MAG TPA: type IV pilus biogenesis/stability protein PilW [Steroidobacteraceae bacterium]|nr:type IV pilus biogenesis/stability protein PilW [Steroidobacteraceae bacterium]